MKRKMKNKVLIIDGNNLAHRAFHKFHFTNSNGDSSSIVYGVPYILAALLRKFNPDSCFVVFDGDRSPHRQKIWPEYKEGRKSLAGLDADNFYHQLHIVSKVLANLNVHVIHRKDQEADDIIYILARLFRHKRVTIVSSDKDFNQLLGPKLKVWNPFKDSVIHYKNVRGIYGYTSEECVDWLCLEGDKSDNIEGVRGMGPKTIRKFLDEYETIDDYLDWPVADSRYDKFPIKEVYQRNFKLISLGYFFRKHNLGLTLTIDEAKFNMGEVQKLIRPFEIRSFTKPEFKKVFERLV